MNDINFEKIGKRLKTQREALGLKQRDVADGTHIDPSLISRYEKGCEMSVFNLALICQFLHCSMDYIIYGEGYHKTDGVEESTKSKGARITEAIDALCYYFSCGIEIGDWSRTYLYVDLTEQYTIHKLVNFVNSTQSNTIDFDSYETQRLYKSELRKYAKKITEERQGELEIK